MPDTSDPPERDAEEHATPDARSEISLEDYHHHADQFFEKLVAILEAKQEEKADLDSEYSVSSHRQRLPAACVPNHAIRR